MITRLMWGAKEPVGSYVQHKPCRIILHHTGTSSSVYNGSESVKIIQNYHMHHNKWADIGYHFLIGPDGSLFEGRPEWAQGAHTKVKNRGSIGISIIGDMNDETLTESTKRVLITLIQGLMKEYGITSDKITGHRDHMATECPGKNLYDLIPEIRKAVDNG